MDTRSERGSGLLRGVARPLLAGMFVYGGLDAVRNPESKVAKAEPVIDEVADALGLPDEEPAQWVRFNGAVQVAAGASLAVGRLPRLSAFALAMSLVPTTLAGHRFWEEVEPSKRATQTIQFLKNAAMLGGLLFAIVDHHERGR